MTTYLPAAVVLPEYTDESLGSPQSEFGRGLAALLLTIPAEYRQSAMAEVAKRTSREHSTDSTNSGVRMIMIEIIDTGRDEHAAVVAEIRAQLGL